MSEIREQADALRARAVSGPIGKRHSSFELYALLADCMALAERCREEEAYDDLRAAIALQGGVGGPRRYAERASDEYLIVCRYVFAERSAGAKAERSNASRYAHALREAAKRQINSKTLEHHLREKGGINALFLTRPLAARTCTTKTLYLSSQVTVPKQGTFTLTLSRRFDGAFDVVNHYAEAAE